MKSVHRKKRYRLREDVKRFLIYSVCILIITIFGIINISRAINEIKYQKSYEYRLLAKGYANEDVQKMLEVIPEAELEKILNEEEISELYPNIVKQKYFITKNYEKYIEYITKNKKTSYEDTIAIVNVNANKDWYTDIKDSNTDDGYLILVNRYNKLKEDYERADLEIVSLAYSYGNYGDTKLASIVYEEFIKMHNDINEELNVHLMINGSYESYKELETQYNNQKKYNSLKELDQKYFKPGHSEHQTGLALDINSQEHSTEQSFKTSEEYKWIKNNAHKYGFIIRYPEDKSYLTGYNKDSWHLRYIGTEAATQIYNEGITFEEYYAYYIVK